MISLKIGDKAPDFKSKDENGAEVKLATYKGKKVVLYFYPKDDTPGCTAEACSLRDNYAALQKEGYEVIGVSRNDKKSHAKFKAKYELPFTLLADTDKAVHDLYGTWVEKSMYGRKYMGTARVTFLINEKGIITDILEKVNTKEHAAQIMGWPIAPEVKVAAIKKPKPVVKAKPIEKVFGEVKTISKTQKATKKVEPTGKKRSTKKAEAYKALTEFNPVDKKVAAKKKAAAKNVYRTKIK